MATTTQFEPATMRWFGHRGERIFYVVEHDRENILHVHHGRRGGSDR